MGINNPAKQEAMVQHFCPFPLAGSPYGAPAAAAVPLPGAASMARRSNSSAQEYAKGNVVDRKKSSIKCNVLVLGI